MGGGGASARIEEVVDGRQDDLVLPCSARTSWFVDACVFGECAVAGTCAGVCVLAGSGWEREVIFMD
eukprot:5969233-Pleurochrysis_carterae.AAC.7